MPPTTAQSLSPLELLEKIDAFYKTSWEHLIIFGGIAAVVIGIVVPLLLQYSQTRQFKREEATVAQAIRAQVEHSKASLAEAYKQELASLRDEVAAGLAGTDKKVDGALAILREEHGKELEKLRERLGKAFARLEGAVFHVQGFLLIQQQQVFAAADSLLVAALSQLSGEDELNQGRAINLLVNDCLPKLDKQLIASNSGELVTKFETLIEALKSHNNNGRHEDRIRNLRVAIKAAQTREATNTKAA